MELLRRLVDDKSNHQEYEIFDAASLAIITAIMIRGLVFLKIASVYHWLFMADINCCIFSPSSIRPSVRSISPVASKTVDFDDPTWHFELHPSFCDISHLDAILLQCNKLI
jgi:hypothetical protein